MTAQEIEDLIQNSGVSDEEVLRAIKEYTADKYDDKGELLPHNKEAEILEKLGTLTRQLRPKVMGRFQEDFIKEHAENCPACQALKGNS